MATSKDDSQYLMSGGLAPSDPHPSTVPSYSTYMLMEDGLCRPNACPIQMPSHASVTDTNTLCTSDLHSLIEAQPYRVISHTEVLEHVAPWVNDMQCIEKALPWYYLTTIYGLEIALRDVEERATWDDSMLAGALLYVGGYDGGQKKVTYPEDIIPFYGPEDAYHEAEYWEAVREQGRTWQVTGVGEDDSEKWEMTETGKYRRKSIAQPLLDSVYDQEEVRDMKTMVGGDYGGVHRDEMVWEA